MVKTILSVEGMSCDHCVKAVTNAVNALPGVFNVKIDLETGTVTVEHDPGESPLDKIKFEIEEQGYDVVS